MRTLHTTVLSILLGLGLQMQVQASPHSKPAAQATAASKSALLEGSYRFDRNGWSFVHLEGTPQQVGYQHGYLLATEILDVYHVLKLEDEHGSGRHWSFFRDAGKTILWPHLDAEYQQELQGIADGVKARGIPLDVWDIVAMNGSEELESYYVPWLDAKTHAKKPAVAAAPGNCSAFVATGSYTRDGKIVLAHNNWSSYAEGSRWTVAFDIKPQHGKRIVMDGMPGFIDSGDDFGINSAGILSAETTITQFVGWDSNGKAEFMRARKAMQYAGSINEYVAIMREGNNGGYANDWLIGDRNTGEIAYLELGLKNTPLWRTKDGYYVSSNFPRDPKLMREETPQFDSGDMSSSPNARKVRWEELMQQDKGSIDMATAEQYMADHKDSYTGKDDPGTRGLCGHLDASKEGVPQWDWGPFDPAGAVQGKVTTSDLAGKMSFIVHAGHPCGEDFLAKPFLAAHPEYAWEEPILKDMKSGAWTEFHAGQMEK